MEKTYRKREASSVRELGALAAIAIKNARSSRPVEPEPGTSTRQPRRRGFKLTQSRISIHNSTSIGSRSDPPGQDPGQDLSGGALRPGHEELALQAAPWVESARSDGGVRWRNLSGLEQWCVVSAEL